jgi:hypothetical protein
MTVYTICFSARGTGVLRTESIVADEAQAAIALVKRRLGASRTFQEARVFEEGELRFNVSSDANGLATAGGETRSRS